MRIFLFVRACYNSAMITHFELGDRVVMRKPHACGTNEWVVVRTGADVKIRCCSCNRVVMLDRGDFLKRAKKNLSEGVRELEES